MVDAVLVNYNTRAQALRAIEALRTSSLTPNRIVVVDTSPAGSAGALGESEDGAYELIRRPDNPGYGAAINSGLQATSAPLAVACNADVYPTVDALQTLVGFAETHPDVACLGPALLNPDGSIQDAAFRFPGLAEAVLDIWPVPAWVRTSCLGGRVRSNGSAIEIDYPLGAFMLLRRLAVDLVGRLSPEYWMYSEEIDLCWRLRAIGWRIMHVPQARVWHVGAASTGRNHRSSLEALYRSRFRWYRRRTPAWKALLARAGMRTGLWLRAAAPGSRRSAYAAALDAVESE